MRYCIKVPPRCNEHLEARLISWKINMSIVSKISVEQKDFGLVIDSTLIARRLEVHHGDWMQGIVKKYQSKIEQRFGALRFENRVLKAGNGATKQIICWFKEDQALFVTTLSRNSDAVIECKADIVQAFSDVRKALSEEQASKPMSQAEIMLGMCQQMVQQEKQIAELTARVDSFENKQKAAEKAFVEAPLPEVSAPALTLRTQINRIVRDFCFATGCDYQFAWRQLYREFRDLYHIDLYARAKSSRISKLDACEALGMLKDLYATAYTLFAEAIEKNA